MVKVIFYTIRNCSKRKEFAPSGSKIFLLREVPILKRNAIEDHNSLVQLCSFSVRNLFSVLNTPFEN